MLELFLAAAAFTSQEPAALEPEVSPIEAQEAEARASVINQSPPGRTLGLLEGADVSLEISEKKSELALGYSWDRVHRVLTEDRLGVRVSHTTLNLGLTLPVGGADNLLSSDTFDGFAAGPTISASWTWFGWTSRDRFEGPAFGRIMDEAIRRCLENPGPERDASYCNQYQGRPNAAFAEAYSGSSRAQINRTLHSSAWGFGIEGELGFDVFDYNTPITLVENSRTEPNFSATASIFYFPSDGVSLLGGSVEYENHFKARADEILCRAVIADPNDDCVNAPAGPPRHVERLSLGLEYRRALGSVPGLGRFAIAPQGSYDVIGDHFSAELPIYLIPEGDSAFLPGLSFSYDSEDDEFVVGFFLRKSFSLGR